MPPVGCTERPASITIDVRPTSARVRSAESLAVIFMTAVMRGMVESDKQLLYWLIFVVLVFVLVVRKPIL